MNSNGLLLANDKKFQEYDSPSSTNLIFFIYYIIKVFLNRIKM